MALQPSLASWLFAFVPGPALSQAAPEVPTAEPGLADLAVLGLLAYVVYVAFSIGLGVLVLAVSELVFSDSYVRAVERRIYDRPVRTAVLGFAVIVSGFLGVVVLTLGLLALTGLGAPEPLALLVAVPFFGGMLFLYVASTIGTIVAGSYLLRWRRDGESNLWFALVVGALVVNVPVLNFVLAFLVLFLGTGAMVGQWWSN